MFSSPRRLFHRANANAYEVVSSDLSPPLYSSLALYFKLRLESYLGSLAVFCPLQSYASTLQTSSWN
jgi:hypothetical protein